MLRANLTLALRSLWRNRTYTLLNISGIAIGLAAVTLIYWQVTQIKDYDTQHPHADRLYRVGENKPSEKAGQSTVVPLLPALLRETPVVETGVRLISWQRSWISYKKQEEQLPICHADTSLFSVLNFPLKLGDPRTALATPNAMVLSEKVAERLFPNENPMDKTVVLDNGRAYVIRGVLAARPPNTVIQAEVIVPIADLVATDRAATENWYNASCQTFVRLRPGRSDASASSAAFAASTAALVKQHYTGEGKQRVLSLLPIKDIFPSQTGGLLTVILYGLGCIAGFILLIVAINFLNLTSALSLARAGEVALRTTLGAATRQILGQFVLEATLVGGAGAILGTLLLKALLPVYIDFFDISSRFSPQLPFSLALLLVGIVLLLGTLAGWLPGRYLIQQPVVTSLQGKTTTRRSPFRSTLVVIQFALATVMITCTGIMISQNRFVRNQQVGFNKDNIIAVELNRSYRNPALAEVAVNNLINRLRQNDNVLTVSTTKDIPGRKFWSSTNTYTDLSTNRDVSFDFQGVDDTYLTTFQIPLVAGRNLAATDTAVGDLLLNGTGVLINEAGARAMGYKTVNQAVGKVMRWHGTDGSTVRVVGVFRDYYQRGMHQPLGPMLFWATGPARLRGNNWLSIRVKPGTSATLLTDLAHQFGTIPARKPFNYIYLSDEYNSVYRVMDMTQTFLTGMALITVLLACAGVFGLSLFGIRQRTKEIGIRKVLGASVTSVAWLLSQRTVRLVGVAVLISVPLAWVMMNTWLNSFATHIAFPWWVVAVSGLLALLVALLTVSTQSIRAALTNPVKSLRSE
ncbi:ABC transporter permease [Fibrella aquatilis]|uniref:ABC transporter permease n=1 Tax=Fibrella aquatilis TaxID=2817059 RepID=A0A939K315_9BACT|nr:ABC transporter permease [Fibrella aquatilis]MBO0934661.1 ABC transporter permease [Fibrella aquatilis]